MRLAVAVMLLATSLSGCFLGDLWSDLNRPDIAVNRTDLSQTNEFGYVTSSVFSVGVADPEGADVQITATRSDGTVLESSGYSTPGQRVELTLSDGTWTVKYSVAGHPWETFKDVRVDATPPSTQGLETFVQSPDGSYTIGSGYEVEPGVVVEVRDAQGQVLGNSLPVQVDGLGDGVHFFVVLLRDEAGNEATHTLQIAAGDATRLPDGKHTFGIVARYTNQARIWDLSDMDTYPNPSEAQGAVGGAWLGAGYGITPDEQAVQDVVAQVITDEDTTMEIAWALFEWLVDELEYDDERLASDTLMLPRQVILDAEDPDPASDDGGDGLADDGPGNGVKGGVCRDLAATYVSLLRAAGVPARLVSGYLAGTVNGFHAWVEFYGGGESPWVPVDVSPIDGAFEVNTAVQAFGIELPSYLALRSVPEESELEGWSTALGTSFSYPSDRSKPQVEFAKELEDVGQQEEGLLCFDPETLERRLAQRTNQCPGMYIIGRDQNDPQFANNKPFITATQRVIDYGVQVESAPSGSTITMHLSYPFPADVEPDEVEFSPYNNPGGYRFTQQKADPETGKITGVLRT